MTAERPNGHRNLDLALEREYGRGREATQARTAMANAINRLIARIEAGG